MLSYFLVGASILLGSFALGLIGIIGGLTIIPVWGYPLFFVLVSLLAAFLFVVSFVYLGMIDIRDHQITAMREAMAHQTEHIEVPYVFDSVQWDYDITPEVRDTARGA